MSPEEITMALFAACNSIRVVATARATRLAARFERR